MCVAAVIKRAVPLSDLQNMEIDNPHGAGVAWAQDGEIQFRRGLTAAQIFDMQTRGEMTYPYLLHFRWATHGPRVPELTHPFPTGIRAFGTELVGAAPQVMIHNGVWSEYTKWVPYIDDVPSEVIASGSDTSVAAYFIPHFPDLAETIPWAVAVAEIDDRGDLQITQYGRGWSDYEGNQYSNLSWQSTQDFWSKYRTPRRAMEYGWTSEDFTEYADVPYGVRGSERFYAKKPVTSLMSDADAVDLGFDDWVDYVRARYGDEAADAILEDAPAVPHEEDQPHEVDVYDMMDESGVYFLGEDDVVSEDPTTVNSWLARQERKMRAA